MSSVAATTHPTPTMARSRTGGCLLLAAALGVASACSTTPTTNDAGTTGPAGDATAAKLTIAITADRGPVNIFSGIDDRLTELVYDKLLAPTPYVAEPQPWLAEEVRQIDPSTVEVRIRSGVTWHDGVPFTPDDVKFTFEYYKTAVTGRSSQRNALRPVTAGHRP